MDYQPHLQGYTPFKTAIEGIEVLALIEYHEGFEDYDGWVKHDADIESIIFAGADIYQLCAPFVIETIRRRFLEAKEAEFEDMKAEQQIRNWEDRQ